MCVCGSHWQHVDGKESRLKCTARALVASLRVYYSGIVVFVCACVCVCVRVFVCVCTAIEVFLRLLVGDQSLSLLESKHHPLRKTKSILVSDQQRDRSQSPCCKVSILSA